MSSTITGKNPQQSYMQLLNSIRDELRSKYSQKPQLSCSHPMVCLFCKTTLDAADARLLCRIPTCCLLLDVALGLIIDIDVT